ncbi:MAG: DEAD/DEAH box helicase [Flavobacteriales bacterium]|nr:DEAD/DEAH box helicase [Flavobacteriia bacterium]NCP06169.1 DEAD/DEAH box helicase [Flavobacteriales bacterium]PIV94159.1 MAG: DEAD/DEAH box helicase [Flavobacteriaceae bacterium CG17_big_fil_post_rev_8_21_14_2_50_33_15]PIY09598.1 MAG: DEAD/DEAH box helicase [Flavobacteriaceae bacterium CG_4_10_14_3_um_filter_33_47]PJB17371.1 MAG: DEAD/DEAH box helicase [Flavobacteriaceae bacterium CG_4_9_14_3_um_filter_33_16]
MSFKKIIEPLKETLLEKGLVSMLPLQKQILSKIKGGINMFCIAPKGSGKTTSIILSVIQKLNGSAFEDAPRALIFVKDKEAANQLADEFKPFLKGTDLRMYLLYDEYNIELQREELYLGADIVIATPKRLNQVFYLNGINLNSLQMFIVEDAEFLFRSNHFAEVARTPESIEKCQYLIFSSKFDQRFERWQESFMFNSQIFTLT